MRTNRFGFAELAAGLGPAIAIAILEMGSACSHVTAAAPPPHLPPCPSAQPIKVRVSASQHLNPGEKGEALATVLRIYQLKGIGRLTGKSFDDFLDHDKDALGEDFLNVQELTINPGDQVDPHVTRSPDASYLLAVALFRRPAGTTWKVVRELSPLDSEYCRANAEPEKSAQVTRLFLDENRLELR
jgi:type VI secretion system VasD/TssJ family lipoprotein